MEGAGLTGDMFEFQLQNTFLAFLRRSPCARNGLRPDPWSMAFKPPSWPGHPAMRFIRTSMDADELFDDERDASKLGNAISGDAKPAGTTVEYW